MMQPNQGSGHLQSPGCTHTQKTKKHDEITTKQHTTKHFELYLSILLPNNDFTPLEGVVRTI